SAHPVPCTERTASMTRKPLALAWLTAALLALATGCSPAAVSKEEQEVKGAFEALQKAIKGKDTDKVWQLLDAASQADDVRPAKAVREADASADEAKRKDRETDLGLAGKELEKLDGAGFLKTKRFQAVEKYKEIPGSTIKKVTVSGEKGTVEYTEPDGDPEK